MMHKKITGLTAAVFMTVAVGLISCGQFKGKETKIETRQITGSLQNGFFSENSDPVPVEIIATDEDGINYTDTVTGTDDLSFSITIPVNKKYIISFIRKPLDESQEDAYLGYLIFFSDEDNANSRAVFFMPEPSEDLPVLLGNLTFQKTLLEDSDTLWSVIWSENNLMAQIDTDFDGITDIFDKDDDNDGMPDVDEQDGNNNNIPDEIETAIDTDGDGIINIYDQTGIFDTVS